MASLVAYYLDNNKEWHEPFFFMFGIGWKHFPDETSRSESSLCWPFGSTPECHKREVSSLNSEEGARVATIVDIGSID